MNDAQYTCTISGSFRKYLTEVSERIRESEREGILVLSPRSTRVVGEDHGFVFFEGEPTDPYEVELGHLEAISKSDFLWVVNPDGYIGTSASMEIGCATANSVPVFCTNDPEDYMLQQFVTVATDIGKVRTLLERRKEPCIPIRATLPALQSYINQVVRIRGFGEESVRDVLLLLTEEVGELARAVRKHEGLKVGQNDSSRDKTIDAELADCLIYLLDLANLTGIDLASAFFHKESENAKRTWTAAGEQS